MMATNSTAPRKPFTENPAVARYTIAAGIETTPEYISPMRNTVSSRDAMIECTGMGMESRRSLSRLRYSPENVLNTLPNAPMHTAASAKMR